jgi:hypothetical protein
VSKAALGSVVMCFKKKTKECRRRNLESWRKQEKKFRP